MDLRDLDKFREGNRLEAKSAKGGLPKSMWETYSAFANSRGGVILLGVVEGPDGELMPEGVPKPSRRIDEIWNNLRDRRARRQRNGNHLRGLERLRTISL
ncbi:MAG: ATP-binding protein [Atopobiaceae bacterium]|nr:ATP-binding protein [Atopobiaceae bacterium]